MKQQFEERLTDLNEYAEQLQKENDVLKKENMLWKERADAYLSQNISLKGEAETLRIENGELKEKVRMHATTGTQRNGQRFGWPSTATIRSASPATDRQRCDRVSRRASSMFAYTHRWRRPPSRTHFSALSRSEKLTRSVYSSRRCSRAAARRSQRCKR